jgi:hypothetical protein
MNRKRAFTQYATFMIKAICAFPKILSLLYIDSTMRFVSRMNGLAKLSQQLFVDQEMCKYIVSEDAGLIRQNRHTGYTQA